MRWRLARAAIDPVVEHRTLGVDAAGVGAEIVSIEGDGAPMAAPVGARLDLDDRPDQPAGAVRHVLWLARHRSSTHSRSRPS
jgi:hypothetical protein